MKALKTVCVCSFETSLFTNVIDNYQNLMSWPIRQSCDILEQGVIPKALPTCADSQTLKVAVDKG